MAQRLGANELVLVRHAPVAIPDRLFGRTDVEVTLPASAELDALKSVLPDADACVSSPALRCRMTAEAIWDSGRDVTTYPDLWEQDFGEWEGQRYADLPDIGTLSGDALAAHAPPGGESFEDVVVRVAPRLRGLAEDADGPVVAVVHAGVIRAALAMAVGSSAAALRFEIDCLSLTRFRVLSEGSFIIKCVNQHTDLKS